MIELTPRERVTRALAHQEPDRVPLDLGGGQSTTLVGEAYERLASYLGTTNSGAYMTPALRLSRLDEETLVRLGGDVRPVLLKAGAGPTGPPTRGYSETAEEFETELGVNWRRVPFEGGYYFEQSTTPLAEATIEDLETYAWPDPNDPARYEGLEDEVLHLYHETPYALMGDCSYKGFWEPLSHLLGFERALLAVVTEPEFVTAVLEKLFEINSTITRRFLEITGPYLAVFRTADDLATQESLLISPDTYRAIIKPFHRRYIELVKRYTDAKIFYHSDGNIAGLLDDLLDVGIEILNPVQVSALKDPAGIKKRYGDRLSFWGAIDTQRVLPTGTVDEVRDEVRLRIEQFGSGGGYVAASVHNIQADVSPENIVALCDAVREYGRYPVAA